MKADSNTLIRFTAVMAVLALLVSASPAAALAQSAPGLSLTVTISALNVRQGPGTNYPILGALHQGDQRIVSGRDAGGAWYQAPVLAGGAQLGWVFATYVHLTGDATTLPIVTAPAPVSLGATAAPTTGSAGKGGTIVFQSSSGGPIYVMNADGTNLRHLTTGMDPAISPDGRWVAFTRWDGSSNGVSGALWVIGIDGSGERQVLGNVSQPKAPTWSSDSTKVVINYQDGGFLGPYQVCSSFTDPKTKEVKQFCHDRPANPYWGLRVVNMADGSFEDLNHDFHAFAPTWDPANAWHVVYQAAHGLMALDLTKNTTWNIGTDTADRAPVFSPDGSKIADSYWQTGNWEIHVLNADGSGAVRLTQTSDTVLVQQLLQGQTPHSWNNAAPTWSPDGSRIAFLTDRNGPWQIWIMNADGSNQHPLFANGLPNGITIDYGGLSERVMSWR